MDRSTPPSVAKTVRLVRHGAAAHNVHDPRTGARPDLTDPRFTDPPLVRQGELQARALGAHLRRRGLVEGGDADGGEAHGARGGGDGRGMDVDGERERPIELVVCSPLSRCLQTASLLFPSHFQGDASCTEQSTSVPTNKANSSSDVHVLKRNCRVCCHGDVREAYGMHYPDKRSSLSRLKRTFPTVAYHPSLTENDDDWKPDARETRDDVKRRTHKFFAWLVQQPHENIAIVTHGVWMECALSSYCPEALDYGKKRVYNCDVYCGKLVSSIDGEGVALRDMEQMTFYHA